MSVRLTMVTVNKFAQTKMDHLPAPVVKAIAWQMMDSAVLVRN